MDVYNKHNREAVRVKVRKCEPGLATDWRKFSVDPQITTLEVLYSLLAKAFDIKSDFSIKYKAFDPAGNELYLSVLSDWDLDAAFLRIHNLSIQTESEPCLVLQIDVKPFTEVKEFDAETPTSGSKSIPSSTSIVTAGGANTATNSASSNTREIMAPFQQSIGVSQKYVQNMQNRLPGLIMNQMEKTFSMVQKAFNLSEETMSALPPRPPLSDNEFRLFLDALGQIQRTDELRKVIFFGGIEPGLRRVVWKHILNVYPSNMNGHQRMEFMRRKSEQYLKLRATWKNAVKQGCIVGELGYVTSMVKKDVLRTDRLHPFYAGSDDNQNIASLFNILTTYALNHPTVSYCQGMSDIASPLLVTMNDEAQAYICFCAIMFRVRGNFMLDGVAMTQKFAHLSEALSYYDPEFWDYLKSQQADDLLFCYRWLLLELKREFPFDDALRMLEVQWSSLKYETSVNNEMSLFEKEFVPIMETSVPTTASSLSSSFSGGGPTSPSYLLAKQSIRENPYTKFCALRRQSSTASLSSLSSSLGSSNALESNKRLNQSLDDNISRHILTRRQRQVSSKAHQSLDEAKMLMLIESSEKESSALQLNSEQATEQSIETPMKSEDSEEDNVFQFHPTNPFKDDVQSLTVSKSSSASSEKNVSKVFLSSRSSSITEDEQGGDTTSNEQLTSKNQNKNIPNNYNTVSNIIAKQLANATTVGETVKRVGSTGGGHFKDLKERIAATSKKGLSFDELTQSSGGVVRPPQKLVKNFNEFLNFANVNKSRIADKFAGTNALITQDSKTSLKAGDEKIMESPPSTTPPPPPIVLSTHAQAFGSTTGTLLAAHPLVQLTKSSRVPSLDDSDSTCSVPDTTWSNSTNATAIQQLQNASYSSSLHLELNSNFSYTPDRTPATFSPLKNELASDVNATPEDSQDNEQDYYPITTAITRELRLEADNLDRQVFGDDESRESNNGIEYEQLGRDSRKYAFLTGIDELNLKENEIIACPDASDLLKRRQKRLEKSKSEKSALDGNHFTNRLCGGCDVAENIKKSSSINNYRLNFDDWNDDEDDDNDGESESQTLQPITTTTITTSTSIPSNSEETPKSSSLNPFIEDTVYSPQISNSNSLPEVLVPVSTDVLDSNPLLCETIDSMATVELATNATDVDADDLKETEVIYSKSISNSSQSTSPSNNTTKDTSNINVLPQPPVLPAPHQFGGGNPFLMFLCLTLLLQHRNTIMKSSMDYNEIAMHFDKMVRKHDVTRVLNQARRMYIDYLKVQNAYKQRLQEAATMAATKKTSSKNQILTETLT